MVELRVSPARESLVARYEVAVAWHTYDEASGFLLEQAAIRQDLALRISKQAVVDPDIFKRYGYTTTNATPERQLRATLLDEARRLIDLAHSLVDPEATEAQRQDALTMFDKQYHNLTNLRHDTEATATEWALESLASRR